MYMPWVPCISCAVAIISSGIKYLHIHYEKVVKTPDDWFEDTSEAVKMLLEADVEIRGGNEYIGNCEAKFRGKIWCP